MMDWELEIMDELIVQFKSKGSPKQNSLSLERHQSLIVVSLSTNWIKPIHIMEVNLLYLSATNYMLIWSKTPHSQK